MDAVLIVQQIRTETSTSGSKQELFVLLFSICQLKYVYAIMSLKIIEKYTEILHL